MSASVNIAVRASGVLRYLPPYSCDECVLRYEPHLNARRFQIMTVSQTFRGKVCREQCMSVYEQWKLWWKPWCVGGDTEGYTDGTFVDTPFTRSVAETAYRLKVLNVLSQLREEDMVLLGHFLPLLYGSDTLTDKSILSNHKYWAKDNDFEVCLYRHVGQHRTFFVVLYNYLGFAVPP